MNMQWIVQYNSYIALPKILVGTGTKFIVHKKSKPLIHAIILFKKA